MRLLATGALLSLCLAAALGQAAKLNLGDTPPPLKAAKWYRGTPPKSLKDGKVRVVSFWATWSKPSLESIPHLNELSKKYSGKAEILGVSVFENPPNKKDPKLLEKVGAFVKQMGPKIAFAVGADGPDSMMANTWMKAANQGSIPTVFVIDKQGKLAWIGHPMELDKVLPRVVAGTWSLQAAKEEEEKAMEEAERMARLFAPLQKAIASGDERAVVTELDKLFAAEPKMEQLYGAMKFEMLLVANEPKAYEYARGLLTGLYRNDSEKLNNMAWEIVNDENKLDKPDYALAVQMAERAVELTKRQDAYSMDTLAYAYFKSGDQQKGIATSELAVALAEKSKSVDKDVKAELKARLELMKKKAAKGG